MTDLRGAAEVEAEHSIAPDEPRYLTPLAVISVWVLAALAALWIAR